MEGRVKRLRALVPPSSSASLGAPVAVRTFIMLRMRLKMSACAPLAEQSPLF